MQATDGIDGLEAENSSHPQSDHDARHTATPPSATTEGTAAAARALSNAHNPLLLSSMLDLRDVCRLSFLCRETRGSFGRRARKICLTHGAGVPDELRIEFWTCVLNVKKEREDHEARARRERGASDGSGGDVYEACLYGDDPACGSGWAAGEAEAETAIEAREGDRPLEEGVDSSGDGKLDSGAGDASDDHRVMPPAPPQRPSLLPPSGWRVLSRNGAEGEISRDVGRTFPRQELFKSRNGPGQNLLANVLKACLKTNPDVGYCQGMNFVAGSLLLACATRDPAVHETFYTRPSRNRRNRTRSGSRSASEDDAAAAAAAAAAEELSPFVATTAAAAAAAAAASMSCTSSSWEGDGSGDDENQPAWRSGPAHLRAEKDVFWLMLALTSRISGVGSGLGMRELWLPGVPQLKVRVFQFDKLMLRELPRLYNHFKAKQLQLEGEKGIGWVGPRMFFTGAQAVTRKSSSVRLLRACSDVKLTRSTLNGLQQDFAVQLLKEHLQGEGQWLTRYGDAPDPSPGAGAGVIGGDRDGDVGFMGGIAPTRMMLSDSKLLKRLKKKLAQMAAPLQADARVFQNKITEASERLEQATRERSSLSGELLCLKEDIEALGQRKKLVTEQMHLLLVQFERDTAVPDPGDGQEEGSGSGGSSSGGGSGGGGGGTSGRGENTRDGAIRVSPTPSTSSRDDDGSFIGGFHDLGSVSGLDGDAVGAGVERGGVSSFYGASGSSTHNVDDGRSNGVSNSSSNTLDGSARGGDVAGADALSSGVERLVIEPRGQAGGGDAAGVTGEMAASSPTQSSGEREAGFQESNGLGLEDYRCSSTSSFRSRSTSEIGDGGDGGGDHSGDETPVAEGQQQQQQQLVSSEGIAVDSSATAAAQAEEAGMGAGSDVHRSPDASVSVPLKADDVPGDGSSESPVVVTPPRGPPADNTPEVIWNTTSDHTFLQHLPPPPSWEPKEVSLSTLGEAGTATAELSPPPLARNSGRGFGASASNSDGNHQARADEERQQQQQQQGKHHPNRSVKPHPSPRLAAASPGSGLTPLSPQSSPKGGFFMGHDGVGRGGGHADGARDGGGGVVVGGFGVAAGVTGKKNGDVIRKAAGGGRGGGGGGGSPGEGKKVKTAWNRLTKWVASSSSGSSSITGSSHEGGGNARAGAKPSSPLYSNWFASATASTASSSSRTLSAFSRRGGSGAGEWARGTRVSSAGMSSLSPPRIRRRARRGQLSLMEELYRDLEQLKKRLEEVQSGIDDKSEMYATLYHSYTRALTEAEEASELKSALSSQMIQLLFEQEQRLEGYLRECITFDGNSAGPLAEGAEESAVEKEAATGAPHVSDTGGSKAGERPAVKGDAVGSGGGSSTVVPMTTSGVSGGVLRPGKGGGGPAGKKAASPTSSLSPSRVSAGDVEKFSPVCTRGSSQMGGDGHDPGGTEVEDGFERVDSWMAEDFPGGAVGAAAAAADADALRMQREREGSLLVPFPSSYS
ncbi:unnamed protein product [Scytosiphon promiscuus]